MGFWGAIHNCFLALGRVHLSRSENAYFLVSIENGKVVIEPRRNNGKLIEPVITVQQPL
ncbi:MAG: hypothetical protein LVR00_07625 [Rhabdochlamydiaceae bacterium]